MQVSIIYTTSRPEPKLDWFVDGLDEQRRDDDWIELVVVDSLGRSFVDFGLRGSWAGDDRCVVERDGGTAVVDNFVGAPPKPCAWQGPQRVTDRDWWALSSARNTGIVLASSDYVVLVDDRCKLGPDWLAEVRRASAERASVVAGSYEKFEDGRHTVDHRRRDYPDGLENCGGGWLFGCCIAAPLAWLLEVNGFEEGCDGLSGEDYILGLMLANAGRRIDFRPGMRTIQDRSVGSEHKKCRADKGVSPNDKSHAALHRFGKRRRTEFTPDLRELRSRYHLDGVSLDRLWPQVDRAVVHRDWYDGQLISESVPPP